MVILGINGGFGGGHQDTAAVLIQNGKIITAVEEERLNRIKHAQGQMPFLAIIEVLEIAKLEAIDIDTMLDFKIAELLFNEKHKPQS